MEIQEIIQYPLSTEKSIRLMEAENKLVFIVHRKATKQDIKKAVETLFKVKTTKINTAIGPDDKKKAYIQFSPETRAIDIATNLGLM